MPAKRPIAPANEAEAYELHLHLDNTERLYRQRLAIEDLLRRKALKGKYDGSLAPKARINGKSGSLDCPSLMWKVPFTGSR